MRWTRVWPYRSRGRLQAEVDEELGFHLERRAEALRRHGFSAPEAEQEALRRFGDVRATRAVCVAADERREGRVKRRERWHDVLGDARIALRMLRRRPGFAVAAVVTLALAIGAATAMYSVADHVLFRSLPFANVPEIVTLWEYDTRGAEEREVAPGNFLDWQARVTRLERLALAEPTGADLTGDGAPEALRGWAVTPDWFGALGVTPLLGRTFAAEDYRDDRGAVLLSYEFWQRRFGGDASVVGRPIQLNGSPVSVIGVLRPQLHYPVRDAEIWLPKRFRPDEPEDRRSDYMLALARLRPGATLAQARAELAAVARWQSERYPATNSDYTIVARPLSEQLLGSARPALLLLLGAVACVLLIACANVSGLLLARGADRERELAVRGALGCGRARLVRQLMTESLVLAGLGGGAGLLLAAALVRLLTRLAPASLPRIEAVSLDLRVALAAVLLTVVSAVVFGTMPALRAARADLMMPLRAARSTARGSRLRHGLVIGELALALVLLTGAGLLGRSFLRLLDNELGFDPARRTTLQVFAWDLNPSDEERAEFARTLVARFEALPEVAAAAATSALPLHPHAITSHVDLHRPGEAEPPPGRAVSVRVTAVTPGYFSTLAIPLQRGRAFTAADDARAVPVAIVNETLARTFFGLDDPVGRRLRTGGLRAPVEREVVGVVGDVRPGGFESVPVAELYVPHAQSPTGSLTFVVHTRGPVAPALSRLRATLWDEEPNQSIYHEGALEDMLSDTLATRRFHLALLAAFSLLSFALAGLGTYALISYATRMRFSEIGLRMALGARSGEIARMIVGEGLGVALAGIALGLLGSLALTRLLSGMLYGVSATDPLTLVQVGASILAVVFAAAYLPARRAARLDPARTLRAEG